MRSPEAGSGKEGGPDKPSRRWVLKGLASVAAAAATPDVAKALTSQQRLRDREDEGYFSRLTSDRSARKKFQETPTHEEASSVLRSISKAKAPWIDEFNRDRKRMHKGALPFYEKGVFVGNGTILKIPIEGRNEFHYLVVTAAHVANQVPAPTGTQWTRHPQERDVAVRELSNNELARAKAESYALLLAPLQAGKEDVTGKVGAVIAYGNGKGAPVRKLYPSRLSPKVSYKVLRAAVIGLPADPTKKYMREEDFAAVRMIRLPAEEYKRGLANYQQPINLSSGSAFVENEKLFGGIFLSGAKTWAEGVDYDVGFVLDHMYVREAIAEHLKNAPTSPESGR